VQSKEVIYKSYCFYGLVFIKEEAAKKAENNKKSI
jgi:hypothetical protein